MSLSKRESFSDFCIDGEFGILNMNVENSYDELKILNGNFIENGKDKDILDEFTIIKKSN